MINLLLFLFLNTFDAISTVYLVSYGYAIEANPFMEALMNISYSLFIIFKLLISVPIILLFIKQKNSKILKYGLILLNICYGIAFIQHLIILNKSLFIL